MPTTSADSVLARITGPVVMVGFGSIGRGTLPLLDRHIDFDRSRCTVIDPSDADRAILDEYGVRFMSVHITPDNYTDLLTTLLTEGDGQGFCINLSVDTSSLDLMRLCRELGVLYLDTVVEPWPGFYYDTETDNAARWYQKAASCAFCSAPRPVRSMSPNLAWAPGWPCMAACMYQRNAVAKSARVPVPLS